MIEPLEFPQQPADPDELDVGTTLCHGRFTVESRLGRGGVATVYACRDATSGSRIALKVLSSQQHCERDLHRFRNEAWINDEVPSHVNLVQPFELGAVPELDERLYLAAELISGPTLYDLVMVRPLEVERALRLIRGVAVGLEHLHAHGVLHRDIKPTNIIVDTAAGEERARILDFGYAFKMAQASLPEDYRLTLATERPGTKHYMAPEQILGKPATRTSEVYALGVSLYQALTGDPPLAELTPVDAARRKADPEAPQLSLRDSLLSFADEVVEFVDASIQRDPAKRIQNAAAFRVRLDALLASMSATGLGAKYAAVSRVAQKVGESAPREFSRRVAVLCMLVAIVGAAAWVQFGRTSSVLDEGGQRQSAGADRPKEASAVPSPKEVDRSEPAVADLPDPPRSDWVAPDPGPEAVVADASDPPVSPEFGPEAVVKPVPKARIDRVKRRKAPTRPKPSPVELEASRAKCEAKRAAVAADIRARKWLSLARKTKGGAGCWPIRGQWLGIRVMALYRTKKYAECKRLAKGSKDEQVSEYGGLCKSMLERAK